jgi:hypothetical protein
LQNFTIAEFHSGWFAVGIVLLAGFRSPAPRGALEVLIEQECCPLRAE